MKETSFKIVCFAGLKKFFGDEVSISKQLPVSYLEIINELKELRPEASEILEHCRIAVNQEFVLMDSIKADGSMIFIVPPSSGG